MISATIHTALGPLVSGRVFPNTFWQGDRLPTWPAIKYRITGQETNPDLCGTAGVDIDDTDVQIDIAAQTYGALVTLRDQVITALQTVDPPCVRGEGFEDRDPELKVHRAVLLYTFHPSSS